MVVTSTISSRLVQHCDLRTGQSLGSSEFHKLKPKARQCVCAQTLLAYDQHITDPWPTAGMFETCSLLRQDSGQPVRHPYLLHATADDHTSGTLLERGLLIHGLCGALLCI